MRTLLIAVLAVAAGAGAEQPTATVTADRVNLRARPDLQSEVVGQVSEGSTLTVRSVTNEWVEVLPPDHVDFYVHRDFVKDGKAIVAPLNIRSGPGINYHKVGALRKGEPVAVRGEFGEWVRIAPPAACSLWVSKEFLQFRQIRPPPTPVVASTNAPPTGRPATNMVAAPAVPPVPKPPERPVVPPVRPIPPAAVVEAPAPARYVPADLRLAPVENQGRSVQREGRVRMPLLTLSRPSKFVLVAEEGNTSETVCYLRGNEAQMKSFEGRRLRIRGREYWVQGHRYPVVVVDQIAVLPEPAR